jgi:hypothetical protein
MHVRALFISLLLLGFPYALYAQTANVGFVEGLWYSTNTITENVPTRVYVAFRNNTEHDFAGTIRFTDNGTRIGSSDVHALAGRLVEAWVDWTPTRGMHTLSATMGSAELDVVGGEKITLDVSTLTITDTITPDIDTDKDRLGDTIDTDDDGDGVSDSEEKANGTDPLAYNAPQPEIKMEQKELIREPAPSESEITAKTEGTVGEGIERYLDDGISDTLFSNVTDKIDRAKTALDNYREERNVRLSNTQTHTGAQQEITPLGTYTDTATITRSKIETKQHSLLGSLKNGVLSIVSGVWTCLLFITSTGLGYPMLIQIALLIGILILFFRTARRLARRPLN